MRSIFFFISLLTPFFVFSQFNVTCLKLTDTTKNIFYIGVDNPIKVSISKNISSYQIEVEGAGGSLIKTGPGEYIVRVSSPQACLISIKQNGKQVFQKEFKVEMIAGPVATLAGLRDTSVTRNRILLNPFLSVVIPNCYYQHKIQIVSFTATFVNGTDSIPTGGIGNFLSLEQVSLIKEMNLGGKIYFTNIRATAPDEATRVLQSFWIEIQ